MRFKKVTTEDRLDFKFDVNIEKLTAQIDNTMIHSAKCEQNTCRSVIS